MVIYEQLYLQRSSAVESTRLPKYQVGNGTKDESQYRCWRQVNNLCKLSDKKKCCFGFVSNNWVTINV